MDAVASGGLGFEWTKGWMGSKWTPLPTGVWMGSTHMVHRVHGWMDYEGVLGSAVWECVWAVTCSASEPPKKRFCALVDVGVFSLSACV
jgi:hypothetical protein